MTTITYRHESRTIATDGRACLPDGMIINDNESKLFTCESGDVIAAAGDVPLIEQVTSLWDEGLCEEDLTHCRNMSMSAIVYFAEQDKFVAYNLHTHNAEAEQVQWDLTYNYAIGSGDTFALAAMDMGMSAVEAVQYAMTRDSGTGGTVGLFQPPQQEQGDE